MDFLNRLGDIAKNVSDMAVEAVGVGRIAVNIKTEQLKIDTLQRQIGAIIYERHLNGETFSPEIESLLGQIDRTNETIRQLEEEKNAARAAAAEASDEPATCVNCGVELAPGANFCSYCGTKQY